MKKAYLLLAIVPFLLQCTHAQLERAPTAESDVFEGQSVLALTIAAPFDDLAKIPDDIESDETLPLFPVTITYQDSAKQNIALTGKIQARGSTSLTDCDFKKLEVTLDEGPALEASIFKFHKKFKIGTHCADSKSGTEQTNWGRLKSDQATRTEAFIYKLAGDVGLPTYRTRYANINYYDVKTKKNFTKRAFLLESQGSAAKVNGLKKFDNINEVINEDLIKQFDLEMLSRIFYFEALVGNTDFDFPTLNLFGGIVPQKGASGNGRVWNLKVFTSLQDPKKFVIMPYDFDLAVPVRGGVRKWDQKSIDTFNRFIKLNSDTERVAWKGLQEMRSRFPKKLRQKNVEWLKSIRSVITKRLEQDPIPENSKKYLTEWFTGFYAALDRYEETPIVLNDVTWLNTDGEECIAPKSEPGYPARLITGKKAPKGYVAAEFLDIFGVLKDATTQENCPSPGFAPDKIKLGLSAD